MDKYFFPQVRGNSGSSPKEENVFAANCNIQKINPTLKLSKGKKIRINNGNVLRTCTEFYTHMEPPVKCYTSPVITARGKSTVEYQPVTQINKKALCRWALYSFPSSNVAVIVIYNISDLQSQFLKSTSKSPATAHRTRVAHEPNLEEVLWKQPDLQPGQGIAFLLLHLMAAGGTRLAKKGLHLQLVLSTSHGGRTRHHVPSASMSSRCVCEGMPTQTHNCTSCWLQHKSLLPPPRSDVHDSDGKHPNKEAASWQLHTVS